MAPESAIFHFTQDDGLTDRLALADSGVSACPNFRLPLHSIVRNSESASLVMLVGFLVRDSRA
jgi:hypothetical protein